MQEARLLPQQTLGRVEPCVEVLSGLSHKTVANRGPDCVWQLIPMDDAAAAGYQPPGLTNHVIAQN